MLDIQLIRNRKEEVLKRLQIRNKDFSEIISTIESLDQEKRSQQTRLEQLQSEGNSIAKEIGMLFKSGKAEEANTLKERSAVIKTELKSIQDEYKAVEKTLHDALIQLPNIPHESVPAGKSDEDNVVVRSSELQLEKKDFFKAHWDLIEDHDLVSLELGNKITGAGFPLFKGKGAKLQRALVAFFLDEAAESGYTEYIPPLLVNAESAYGTGQLPDKEGQMYECPVDGLYLIPTAEVPLTNIYRNTIINEKELPIKICGHSQCFRREAGSYGKDVRGLNRVHQFEKVEVVQFAHPEQSYEILEEMVAHVSAILEKLELPYRVLRLCGGDLTFASALTYDFEVYSTAQEKWLEVSSVSNFLTFQSRRMQIRCKDSENKKQLVHTLNGSAIALPRIIAALLENNQDENGISIPKVLQSYTGFDRI
ncbi:UNVERIFIED_CONTAM: hypothetical protein GTU68_001955 [Idotea baltica]|nr:hypothetical protein [Idotea baltica]